MTSADLLALAERVDDWLIEELRRGVANLETALAETDRKDTFWLRYWDGYLKGYQALLKMALEHAPVVAAEPDQRALIAEAIDLVPRMSEDDPIAPALADWCRRARAATEQGG